MSWHDSLVWADASSKLKKKASFRKATFFVRDSEYGVGRRNAVHQYPFRDEPYVEDLGLDVDEFTVVGYVVQNKENDQNYFEERDALIQALKDSGPGLLVHPFLGEKTVSLVGKARITESFSEGGIARFTMSFVLAEEAVSQYPKPIVDHVNAVDEAAEDGLDLGIDGFVGIYDLADAAGFLVDSVNDAVDSLNDMIKSAIKSVRNLGPTQMAMAIADLADEYADINSTVINESCSMGNSLINMFNGVSSLSGMYGDIVVDHLFGACSSAIRGISQGPMSGAKSGTPSTGFKASTMAEPALIDEELGKSAVRASLAIARYGEAPSGSDSSPHGGTLEPISITTVVRARQAANQTAMVNLARLTAITTAAKTAIRIDYGSYNSAVEMLDEVVDVLDNQLLKLGADAANEDYATYNVVVADPDGYQALASLRSVFVKGMIGIGATLARVINYEVPPAVLSSLALVYDQYEDLDREQEVLSRNLPLVKHPGFLPGGQTVEVLNE